MEEVNKEEVVSLVDIRTNITTVDVAKSIRDAILEGKVDEAKAGIILKKYAKVAEVLLKDEQVKSAIMAKTETYLNGQKSATFFGATVTKMATYTWYDFSNSNHPVLDALYEIQKEVKAHIESIEEELKLIIKKEDNKIIDRNSLEIPASPSKNILIESMPKLVWEDDGSTQEVKAPEKRQTIGLKYTKL